MCDLRESRNKHRPKRKERRRERERECKRERRRADCQLVLILNYQKLFAIFESFALSAVSGRAGTRREHRGGGVAVATSCLTSCTHSFGTNSLAPYTHTASHTGADSQVYYVWLWPESMQHFNMCVSWRTFACVRERKGEHTGGVSKPAPIVYGTAYNKPGHGNIRRKHLLRFFCPATEFTMLIHNAHPLRSTHLSLSRTFFLPLSLSTDTSSSCGQPFKFTT